MKSVGIIGYGSFGAFLVRKLSGKVGVKVHDPYADVPQGLSCSIEAISKCEYVVLAIPVSAYKETLNKIKLLITSETVLVDISSVKSVPVSLLKEFLPKQKRVIMHPLFGPQSAEESFDGHVVVMCPSESDKESYDSVREYVESLGLKVVEKTPEEHDKEMALAQGLTFFLARALLRSQVHDVELITPSFKKLLDLAELESHHSEDLFKTIQLNNPYTAEMRSQFIQVIDNLNKELL
jgi:prephenate dehydrogenase